MFILAAKFNLNKLSNREKNLVGVLLIVAASTPLYFLAVPMWKEFNLSKSQISSDKTRLKTMEAQIKKLEKLKSVNQKLSKKIDVQKQYLAKSYELDFLAQDLKRICDESSISLESFTPSGAEPINIVLEKQIQSEIQGKSKQVKGAKKIKDKLKGQSLPVDLYRLPIEVRVKGDFTDILALFKKLEKYGRVISVENISVGKIQAKKSYNRLSRTQANEKKETASLFGSFDLVAYSLPREDETLPYSNLEKSAKSTFKFKKKKRK